MSGITQQEAINLLAEAFAPWVQELNLSVVEISDQKVLMEMPFQERLCRIGGTICGQALLSAADTAMVIGLSSALGGFKPMGTVDLNINFMRPISSSAVLLETKILRLGRSMAFCQTLISAKEGNKLSANAIGTYALAG